MSLAGLFMFPTVCKVCPLSLRDKSDCGRPRHTGVWPPAQNEEYFVQSWGVGVWGGGYDRFPVRHENISLPLTNQSIRYNTGTAGAVSSLYLLLSQCGEASQDLARAMALCLALGLSCMSYSVRLHQWNELALYCTSKSHG